MRLPVNIAKFLRTPSSKNIYKQLLLRNRKGQRTRLIHGQPRVLFDLQINDQSEICLKTQTYQNKVIYKDYSKLV